MYAYCGRAHDCSSIEAKRCDSSSGRNTNPTPNVDGRTIKPRCANKIPHSNERGSINKYLENEFIYFVSSSVSSSSSSLSLLLLSKSVDRFLFFISLFFFLSTLTSCLVACNRLIYAVYVDARRLESASVVKLNSRRREAATGRFVNRIGCDLLHIRARCAYIDGRGVPHTRFAARLPVYGCAKQSNTHTIERSNGAEHRRTFSRSAEIAARADWAACMCSFQCCQHIYRCGGWCVHAADKNGRTICLFVHINRWVLARSRRENK